MHSISRNILAVIAGLAVGSAINMTLVMISSSIIPPPADADISTMEGLRNTMYLFEPKHFIFPFLAHALGTLVGAWLAASIAKAHGWIAAGVVGIAFLAGGIINTLQLPSPLWFSLSDLIAAYLPMAFIGWKLRLGKN